MNELSNLLEKASKRWPDYFTKFLQGDNYNNGRFWRISALRDEIENLADQLSLTICVSQVGGLATVALLNGPCCVGWGQAGGGSLDAMVALVIGDPETPSSPQEILVHASLKALLNLPDKFTMNELANLLKQVSERWPEHIHPVPYDGSTFYEIEVDRGGGLADGCLINPASPDGLDLALLFEACLRLVKDLSIDFQLSFCPNCLAMVSDPGTEIVVGISQGEHHCYATLRALLKFHEELDQRK